MHSAMVLLAALVVLRLVLEVAGVPPMVTRFFSATVGLFFVAIYVAAIGPLRGGLRTFTQHLLPALILSAWTEAWVIAATILAALLHLSRSHFAEKEDYGNWSHLGRHVFEHFIAIGALFVIVLVLMTAIHILWRWPVTVAPGAALAVFVIMRFWTEAMGLDTLRTAAWSSSTLVLVSGFYLGGVGARVGLTEARQLLLPSLVLGWVWRFWVFLATVLAAVAPFFKTHFFDASGGRIPLRLLGMLAGGVVEGAFVGMFLWGFAVWMACATGPGNAPPSSGA
jgi:hypothetical protein